MIVFAPLVPIALWVALAVSAVALLCWYAIGSRGRLPRGRLWAIVTLMASALALPLAILLNPTWLERIPPPAGKPLLTVLLDVSASMATRDLKGGKSRYEAARDTAIQVSRELDSQYEVTIRPFAGNVGEARPEELSSQEPEGEDTDLAQAISQGVRDDAPQGQALLVLSDGIHNAGGGAAHVLESAARAKAMAAQLFTKTYGGQASVRDVEVELRSPQELAFEGQKLPVTILLSQQGLDGASAKVAILRDGREIAGLQVALQQGTTEVSLDVSEPKKGLYRYEVQVQPLTGEVTQLNNTTTLLLRVVDEPIRVLLVEGKPYWDTKFLIRTLAADPSIELVSIVKLAEGRLMSRTLRRPGAGSSPEEDEPAGPVAPAEPPGPAAAPPSPSAGAADAPATATYVEDWKILSDPAEVLGGADALDSYQILVLGRDADVYLNEQALANMRKWMARDGGSLVCFRGAPAAQVNQALCQLLPVRWMPQRETRFRVQLTDRGKQLHWLADRGPAGADALAQLPTLAAAARSDKPKPLTVVLAASVSPQGQAEQPVITYQPYGSGQGVVVEGAGMWRWAFLAPQHQAHEQVYGALWQSLVRWLVSHAGLLPTQHLLLRTDKVRFAVSEPATVTLLVREERARGQVPNVVLSGGSLKEPRAFVPIAAGAEPGVYRVAFGNLAEGRYHARVEGEPEAEAAAQTAFDVRRDIHERLQLAARPDLLARLARETQGAVLSGDDPSQLAQTFQKHLGRVRPQRVRRTTAWDRWWVLTGVCLAWGACWAVRRASGLV